MKTLLVIDRQSTNWYEIFQEVSLQSGEEIVVEQTTWPLVSIAGYSDTGVVIDIAPSPKPIPGTSQHKKRMIRPDFVLVRNGLRAPRPGFDHRPLLYGLKYGGVPSVNTLSSIYLCLERPWVFSELLRIQDRLGRDRFPVINQIYYSDFSQMIITPEYPIVVKVGHSHAGVGKMRFRDHQDFEDFQGVIALHEDYLTAEPFLDRDYDIRIQKIGDHYRCYKRVSDFWKGNTGPSFIEDISLNKQFRLWIDECSNLFGGLDICAVDALRTTDGEEYIIELNDTSIGLAPHHETEDNMIICDLVVQRMNKCLRLE